MIRVGADLVLVDDVRDSVATFGEAYLRRIYTQRELDDCRASQGDATAERLAGRFAAKEAAVKVLRPGVGMALTDIEVRVGADGAPDLHLTGTAGRCGDALGIGELSLSITHDGAYAAAVLVAVTQCPTPPSHTPSPSPRDEERPMTDRTDVIRNVLAKHGRLSVDVHQLDDDASLYGAGLTSHATVNVMLALENEFDVEFPERLLRRSTFESIASLDDALATLVGQEV